MKTNSKKKLKDNGIARLKEIQLQSQKKFDHC